MSESGNPTIIFMHQPKTGGGTLNRILQHQYDSKEIFHINGACYRQAIEEFKHLSRTESKKFAVIAGHLFYGFHESIPNTSFYITVLRHPVERVLSLYYYQLRSEHKYAVSPDMTLIEYLHSGIALHADNGMTRFIAGKDRGEVAYGECSQAMLELAKKHIQHKFFALGLIECFDESLILFKRLLGWKQYPLYKRRNSNPQKPQHITLTSQERELLNHYNQCDLELYDYARKIFAEQLRQQDNSFQDEVACFKQLNMNQHAVKKSEFHEKLFNYRRGT